MSLGVAIVTSLFPPSVGGIQTHTWAMARALAERGLAVTVVTRRHAGLPERDTAGRVQVLRVGLGDAPRAVATLTFVLGAVAALRRRRSAHDVLHVHQMLSPLSAGLIAKALDGRPLVVQPHAIGPSGDVAQAGGLRRACARPFVDAFVAISRPIREELRAMGVDEDRVVAIPNGVDVEALTPVGPMARRALRERLGLSPVAPFAAYAGRLSPEKGVDVLISAWPRVLVSRPGAQLLVLGDGAERAALEAQAEALGISGSVHFRGATADVRPYLQAMDAFVLPSRSEGMPMALLEAMACGLPCVATAVGGSPELLEQGVSGILVPSEAPAPLALALADALAPGRARVLGAAARSRVVERHALGHVAAAHVRLYERLVQGRRVGARLPSPSL